MSTNPNPNNNSKSGLSGAVASALSAFSKGGDLLGAAYGAGSKNGVDTTDPADSNRAEGVESSDVEIDDGVTAGGEDVDDGLDLDDSEGDLDLEDEHEPAEVEEDSEESDESKDGEDKPSKAEVGVEEFDFKGKRVAVDFADPEQRKKLVAQAMGMRQFQKERDDARAELKKAQETHGADKQDAQDFRKLSKGWEESGIEGLIRELTGGKQTWDQVYEAERQRRERIAKMNPAERAAYDAEQVRAAEKARADKATADLQKERDEIQKERDTAAKEKLQGYIEPAFERSRFAGKLGDEALEHELDEMLWAGTMGALNKLPDDTVLTPHLIRQEFARRAKALGRAIDKQSAKKSTESLNQKAAAAKKEAQAAMSGKKSDTGGVRNKQIRDEVRSGNMVGAVMAALKRNKK